MKHPRLRDSKHLLVHELYPINEFPEEIIKKIGRQLVYLKCVGRSDLAGNDWGDVFAEAIGGRHHNSPLGLTDVTLEKMAWSMKTIKKDKPHSTKAVMRLIIGRNATDFSFDIKDPYKDIQATGAAVLKIWNDRVNIAYTQYTSLRTSVLVRNFDTLTFSLFEEETHQFVPNSYQWKLNSNNNFEGFDIDTGKKRFTWQPNGTQFTVHVPIPQNSYKFKIKLPPKLDVEETLKQINYSDNWVEIL